MNASDQQTALWAHLQRDAELKSLRERVTELEKQAANPMVLPVLNDDLIAILGRPNFTCSQYAEFLRLDGVEILRKSEHEQAAVIHWFLGMYLQHGAGWCEVARSELNRINDAQQRNGDAPQ